MSKPATRKPGVKRQRKSGWDIDRRAIEAEWEAALLRIPEEILREEIAFWSWPDSPEGELWFEMSDALEVLLKDVGLDAKERKFLWPDARRLDLDQSVRRISEQYQDFPKDKIKEFLIHWIQALNVPEGYSESQMNKFERLTAQWAEDVNPGEN
jgi:hypothetical protein